jgi:hypothetical protein
MAAKIIDGVAVARQKAAQVTSLPGSARTMTVGTLPYNAVSSADRAAARAGSGITSAAAVQRSTAPIVSLASVAASDRKGKAV